HRSDLIFGQADQTALQIGGFANAAVGADIDARVAEQPRHESGNAEIGRNAGIDGAQIRAERQLADVEFLVLESAVENLLRLHRQIGDGAAFHRDAAVPNGARAVVIAAGQRNRNLNQHVPSPRSPLTVYSAPDSLPPIEKTLGETMANL